MRHPAIKYSDAPDGTNSGVRRFGRRYQIGLRLAF